MAGFENLPIDQFCREINEQTLVVVMLESPQAIDNADAIAAVDGIDVLLIGTNDLCAEMGIPGQFGHERVTQAYRTMIDACRRHGKFPGMAGVADDALQQRYVEMGAQFLLADQDLRLMMDAGKRRAAFLRGLNAS